MATLLLVPALLYDVIENGEGEGEDDQPIEQKCREQKWSVRGPGYFCAPHFIALSGCHPKEGY